MQEYVVTEEQVAAFGRYPRRGERERSTVEKYCRDVRRFAAWLGGLQARSWPWSASLGAKK